MSEQTKACTKCGVIKPLTEFRLKKKASGNLHPASRCKDCTREDQREAYEKKGKPKRLWRGLPFAQWTDEMRAAHLKSKEKARRKAGQRPIAQIAEEARCRAELVAADRARRAAERDAQRKVTAVLSEAEKYRWRYRNDPEFREKEKARAIQSKRRVPLWYANQQLGGSSDRRYPMPLLLAKQMQLRIRHQLKEQGHEEH